MIGSNNHKQLQVIQESTTIVLITAPRASSVQIAPIISTFEYRATPNVAAKKLHPLTIIDFIENLCAMEIDFFLVFQDDAVSDSYLSSGSHSQRLHLTESFR